MSLHLWAQRGVFFNVGPSPIEGIRSYGRWVQIPCRKDVRVVKGPRHDGGEMKRLCGFPNCNIKLSMYNQNKYCFSHVHAGWQMEVREEEDKKFKKHMKLKSTVIRNRKAKERLASVGN